MKPKMDMLNGSIWNKIIQYALPVAATGILEQLFNASDLAIVVILLYNFETAIFRSIGETKMPLEALAVSGVLNVALNLFFVIVLKMTVNGVAIETVIANAVSSVFLFIKLVKTDQAIRIRKEELRFDGNVFGRIIRIGLPAGVQSAAFVYCRGFYRDCGNNYSGAFIR